MLLNEIHKSEKRNELILLNCHLYYGVWAKLRKSICSVLGSSSKYMFSERENLAPQQMFPQKKNERKTVKCEAKIWVPVPISEVSFNFACKSFTRRPKNLLVSQNWTSAQWLEYTLGSLLLWEPKSLWVLRSFIMSPKVWLMPHSLCCQFSAQMTILSRGLSTTWEKNNFLPIVCCDIHEKQLWPSWLPSITTGSCLSPAQFLSTSSPLDFQQGCCICNAFSTHWANEFCVANAACNFLMSPCFIAGNKLLPPAPCSSVNTVLGTHLTLAPAAEKISLLTSSAKPPTSPAHIPWSLFHEEYKESASKLNLQNHKKSAVN